jgi:SMODS and SLOG-associating 2TM effector domain 1/Protein of unknown function (DUF4231)
LSDSTVQALWDEHVAWSTVADRLKAQRSFWRFVVLALTVLGAMLQTIAATFPTLKLAAGILGTVALAFVPFLARYFLTAEGTSKWLRARSISEGIKSEIFSYRAGAEPYTGADALETLRKKVREIRDWGQNLQLERAKVDPPTAPAPANLDADAYLRERVYQQINKYYRQNAKKNAELAERFRWAEIVLAGLAAVLSAIATAISGSGSAMLGPWVAVLTTIGGTIAAHAAANRYDFQATTFFATARQLEDLAQDWQAAGKPALSKEWSDFVRACEGVISAENRGWMAKLDEKQTG